MSHLKIRIIDGGTNKPEATEDLLEVTHAANALGPPSASLLAPVIWKRSING